MRGTAKSYIRLVSIITLVTVIVGYSLFSARHLIIGPSITIEYPPNGISTTTSLMLIQGTAENISYITLNDRPIFINEKGIFNEKLLLSPGLNIIELYARDKFKREVSKYIELVLQEDPTESPPLESSTSSTTLIKPSVTN